MRLWAAFKGQKSPGALVDVVVRLLIYRQVSIRVCNYLAEFAEVLFYLADLDWCIWLDL